MKTGKTSGPNPDLWPKAVARLPQLQFHRAPLLTAVCWFAVGELLARNRPPAIVLLLAIVLLSLLTLGALRWSLRITILPLAAIWMTVGCWCAEIQPAPSTQHALATYADGLSRQVRGRVMRVRELPPEQNDADHDKEIGWWPEKEGYEETAVAGALSVDINVDSIEEVTPDISRMVPMAGGVRMNVIADNAVSNNPTPTLNCGDEVQAPMRIKLPERYRDPGVWQYADYLLAQDIGAHSSVKASKILRVGESDTHYAAEADRTALLQCRIYAAQSWASGTMLSYVSSRENRSLPKLMRLNSDDAGMLNAMLFGDRAGLNKTQRVGFERTGSFHLFVVSGMHVGLLAGLVFWLARKN